MKTKRLRKKILDRLEISYADTHAIRNYVNRNLKDGCTPQELTQTLGRMNKEGTIKKVDKIKVKSSRESRGYYHIVVWGLS